MSALTRLWRRPRAGLAPAGFRSAHRTHVGRVRRVNEDRVLDRPDRGLWAVADGMGGHSGGDRAAATAVAALERLAEGAGPITAEGVLEALAHADALIAEQGDGRSGTTIVAGWAEDAGLRLFWAGDSRAYLIRDERAMLLTRDHSVVQQLVNAGALTEAMAARHPQANVVTRALGVGAALEIETAEHDLAAGDLVLLCSDGLSRSLDPRDFAPTLPLEALADRLLLNALRRDGSDNASLVLVEAAPAG